MSKTILIFCLVRILQQKQSDDFTVRLLAVRRQWRYEVSRCGFMGVEND